jgi:hypothetical protein
MTMYLQDKLSIGIPRPDGDPILPLRTLHAKYDLSVHI